MSFNSCHKEASLVTSGSVAERGTSYDVNRRAVYHSIETGSGYEGLASFCSIMNMPCISKPAYQQQIETILLSLEEEANEEMKNAGKELHELMISNETGDVVDIAVSFDGTWAKRGFTSLTGVVFVISVDTGKVLDCHCLSKACQKCSPKKSKCKDELLHCGKGPLRSIIFATSGWLVMETARPMQLWKTFMVENAR